ncbi:hypothetical protein [Tengunoibacter tsumagoiensis]|uniref:Uncharacterized protein n=1 Tax=Tengunoibacter tsumagoiensis TaxID=2014871 RepID=A0A402A234_9CHLR|nr:hypothetical protein [Tengunoibacter tsumagoiensis]GCE13184.1 hypothetical protein KTT_30430 [Tengunoibacter tsumagoiensis]
MSYSDKMVLTSYHLQLGELPCLYGKNYFGPALVGKIGRERLLTTPGVEIRELGDGGIFLRDKAPEDVMSEHLGLVWQSDAKLPDF